VSWPVFTSLRGDDRSWLRGGQVRDVLRRTGADGPLLTADPTVHQAVEALQAPGG
jgi:hypothetical protein